MTFCESGFLEIAIISTWLNCCLISLDLDYTVHIFRKDKRDGVGERTTGHIRPRRARRDRYLLSRGACLAGKAHNRRDILRIFGEHDERWFSLKDARVVAIRVTSRFIVKRFALDERRHFFAKRHMAKYTLTLYRTCGYVTDISGLIPRCLDISQGRIRATTYRTFLSIAQ